MKYYIPSGSWPLKIDLYHKLMKKCEFIEGCQNSADILILPGGSDIGIRKERDDFEFNVYAKWVKAEKPVLGICRGMQIMLTTENALIIQHIPEKTTEIMHTTVSGDWKGQSSWHTTSSGLLTNSRHHQGFFAQDIPDSWAILDKTTDKIVEAIQRKNCFAVQWHPEHDEMKNTDAQDWWITNVKSFIL